MVAQHSGGLGDGQWVQLQVLAAGAHRGQHLLGMFGQQE